jgi:hypothetical protein
MEKYTLMSIKAKPVIRKVDGNAFAILGAAKKAMKVAGYDQETITQYYEDATSGDYNHLLQVSMKYVEFR